MNENTTLYQQPTSGLHRSTKLTHYPCKAYGGAGIESQDLPDCSESNRSEAQKQLPTVED